MQYAPKLLNPVVKNLESNVEKLTVIAKPRCVNPKLQVEVSRILCRYLQKSRQVRNHNGQQQARSNTPKKSAAWSINTDQCRLVIPYLHSVW